jgi:hypothetical protein
MRGLLQMSLYQKQMGAYYTKEDISEYITKNAIILFLLKDVEKRHPAAFQPHAPIWQPLRENPDRYIYSSIRRENYLPTETEREHAARCKRYTEIKAQLVAGKIITIHDLITYNLDISRFAQDVIEHCQENDLLEAAYQSLRQMKIVDPTCGSGAFLLAALNVLKPLYEGCLNRIAFQDFQHHTNLRYFILKTIIDNNLYGVDIMEEAIETCKSQLYLKLIDEINAASSPGAQSGRAGVLGPCVAENLGGSRQATAPDINSIFQNSHIRAGNALVGFVSHQGQSPARTQLDQALARQYGIDPEDAAAFEQWRSKYQPFHWCIEFNKIMQRGGFDVIIGNPPYAEYNGIKDIYSLPPGMYATEPCGNLYAFCLERFAALGDTSSTSGLIVPLSIVCTSSMEPVRRMLYSAYSHMWFNNYDTIPSTLFSGIVQRNTIVLAHRCVMMKCQFPTDQPTSNVYTTRNQKWYAPERPFLFESVSYLPIGSLSPHDVVPKVSTELELHILHKIRAQQVPITSYTQRHSANTLVYKRRWSYFLLFADQIEGIVLPNGSIRQQKDVKTLALQPHLDRFVFIALLSSSLFYFHYSVFSDFRHVNRADFDRFKFDYMMLSSSFALHLSTLGNTLVESYRDNLEWRTCNYARSIGKCQVPFYRQGASKSILDAIDTVLAGHYGMTEEELDFIINYDGKFRMGEKHVI